MAGKRLAQEAASGLRPLMKREIDGLITEVTMQVAAHFEDVAPVRIVYLGEEILAVPMDTRRFVRIMSRYLVFN